MAQKQPPTEEEEFEFVDEGDDEEFEFVDEAKGTLKPEPIKPGIWKTISEAPESVRRFMRSVGESIVPVEAKGPLDYARSFVGGALGGVGEIGTEQEVTGVAGLASPLNLGLMAVGGGEAVALKQASRLKDLGKMNAARKALTTAGALERVRQVGSAPIAYHGATTLLSPESRMSERLWAVPELAGGLAGMRARVPATRRAMEAAPTRLTPEATDIPLREKGGVFESDVVGDIPLKKDVPWRKTPDEVLREAGGEPLEPTPVDLTTPIEKPLTIQEEALKLRNEILGVNPPEQPLGDYTVPDDPSAQRLEAERLAIEEETGMVPEAKARRAELDSRISGLAPKPDITPMPEFGPGATAGPEVKGIPGTELEEPFDVSAEMAKVKTAKEAARAEPKPTPTPAPKPTTIIVKKDIPQTVNSLIEKGYEFLGTTPEGFPRMGKKQEMPEEGPLFQRVQPKLWEVDDVRQLSSPDYDALIARKEQEIMSATDPEIIARNFTELDEALKKVDQSNADQVEYMGTLRDMALDKYKQTSRDLLGWEPEDIQPARTAEGLLKIGSNIKRQAGELTTGYNTALPGIMMREAMQNALDAVKSQGTEGKIKVKAYEDGFEIQDSGKGMSLEELETVFTNLHESGKVTQAGAAGGKGVGKASYMLGGQFFYGETITMENGKPVKYIIQGTPEELMEGFKEQRVEMPEGTPTGTLVRTLFKPHQAKQSYSASGMLHNIMRYSRDQPTNVESLMYGTFGDEDPVPKYYNQAWGAPGKEMGSVDLEHSDVGVFLPENTRTGNRTSIGLKVLNNGMYQYDYYMYLPEETPDIPETLVVNVKPKVEEFDEQGRPNDMYPFPVQRESIKDNTKKEIEDFIKDTIIAPRLSSRKSKLREIYENLTPIPVPKAVRKTVFFDPGDRLTPEEKMQMVNSQQIIQFTDAVDTFLNEIVLSSQKPAVIDKLEGVGIVLDPNMHGVHIPNPSSSKEKPKSIILINPFEAITQKSPLNAALDLGVTIMHEAAHIGTEKIESLPRMRDEDLADPRVGTFLQTYIRETQQQGGIDLGHGMEFIKRLGDLYVRVGARTWLRGTDRIRRIITNKSGGYHSEFTKLLSIYQESRGRQSVTEDYLSGTGVKHAAAGGGAGNVPGSSQGSGSGTTLPKEIVVKQLNKQHAKALVGLGYEASGESTSSGDPIWRLTEQGKLGWQDYLHAPKGLMSVDLPFLTSAGFRQGLPMIGANFAGWAKAWYNSARAYGAPHSYQMIMSELSKHPYFRRRPQPDGTIKESLASELGLAMSDLGAFTRREEVINSKLAEKIKGYGLHVAGSNRSYTAFLNTLRANSLIRFGQQAKSDSRSLFGFKVPGRDIEQDTQLGKEIADAINTLTGRGKLKLNIWGEKASINLEQAAKFLTSVFFSPRLQAARVKMLNPATYIGMDPVVRKLYLKGLIGAVGTWWTIASLMEMLGADVSKDPNNADFGKGRVGNTRVDPGGGFQQLLVLFSRLRPEWFRSPTEIPFPPYGELVEDPGGGKVTSSTTGETEYFGEGFPPKSRPDTLQQFTESKLDPTIKFAWDLFGANKLRPFSLADRTIQLALPIMAGDLVEIFREDPTLLPLVMGASTVGMGASTYEGGRPQPSIVPPEWDIAIGEP